MLVATVFLRNIKALALSIQQLFARLKFQRDLQNDRQDKNNMPCGGITINGMKCFIREKDRKDTFAPSFKFVKQTITVTSSCEIKVQKSAIVFGLGPFEMKITDDYMCSWFECSFYTFYISFHDIHVFKSLQDCYRK